MHGKLNGSDCCCIPEKMKYARIKASLALYMSPLCLVSMADPANFYHFTCAIPVCIEKKSLLFSKEILFSSHKHINDFMELFKYLWPGFRGAQVCTEIVCQSYVWVQWDLESTCLKLSTCCHVLLSKPASPAWKLNKCSNLYYKLKQLK